MISCIPKECIFDIWDLVEPYLKKSERYSEGTFTIDTIKRDLNKTTQLLWVYFDSDYNVKSAWTTRVVNLGDERSVEIFTLGGVGMNKEKVSKITGSVERYASEIGCDSVLVYGRRGWDRVLKPYGYTKAPDAYGVAIRKDIRHG